MDNLGFNEFSEQKFWRQALNEFLGSAIWFILAAQGNGSAWAAGVTFVVVQACFGGDVHLWSPWTIYRMFDMKHLAPAKGIFWLLLQFLGAYAGSHLANALQLAHWKGEGFIAAEWNTVAGFKVFFGLMFILHVFDLANSDRDTGIQRSFMLVFGFAIINWFGVDAANFAWQFAYQHVAVSIWVNFVWTLIAVIVFWAKRTYLLE